jgi:hypothetical protein
MVNDSEMYNTVLEYIVNRKINSHLTLLRKTKDPYKKKTA